MLAWKILDYLDTRQRYLWADTPQSDLAENLRSRKILQFSHCEQLSFLFFVKCIMLFYFFFFMQMHDHASWQTFKILHNILTTCSDSWKNRRRNCTEIIIWILMGSQSEPICRICGSTDGENSIDIFGPEGERHHLEQKLKFCFTKEVSSCN